MLINLEVMWGKTMISGCVRTLAITTQKGDVEPSWGGKLCSVSQTGGGGREWLGKEPAAKQKISLYCCINPWCICVLNAACSLGPQRGCSGMRKSVAVLAGVLQCDRGLWLGVRGRDRAGSSHRVKF